MSVGSGESVEVKWLGSGSVPTEFIWRGRRHIVGAIEGCSSEAAGRGAGGAGWRRRYQLRTRTGLRCQLSVDLAGDDWRMERVLDGSRGD
jgi:hypothetical protein